MSSSRRPGLGAFAAAWAVVGWSATLALAIVRLAMIALQGLAEELTALQALVLLLNTLALAWAEGYRGFQQRFSPRTAARVLYLREHATVTTALLAPLFCIGYFGASARVLRLAWVGTALIVLTVLLVHQLPQPWRGIIDVGVVLGLSWGLVSFLVMSRRALRTGEYPVAPEVPGPAAPGPAGQPGL